MKIKQRVMITQPEHFARGRTSSIYGLFNPDTPVEHMPKEWIACDVIEFEIPDQINDSDREYLLEVVEKEERELLEQLAKLGKTKADLLSNASLIKPTPTAQEMFGEDL